MPNQGAVRPRQDRRVPRLPFVEKRGRCINVDKEFRFPSESFQRFLVQTKMRLSGSGPGA